MEKIRKYVNIEGVQHVENAIAEGNGVILITGHFGNWELLAASISALVSPVTPIVRELRSRSLNSLVVRYRQKAGYATIDRDTGIRDALRCLRRNGCLGIVADVDTTVTVCLLTFLVNLHIHHIVQ